MQYLQVVYTVLEKGHNGVPLILWRRQGSRTAPGGLQSHRPDLVDGVGLIVGIDRFMSEARALTNFTGNAVATVLIGTWTREIDRQRVGQVLDGSLPFDEATMVTDHNQPNQDEQSAPVEGSAPGQEERQLAGAAR